jgi:hypothetical protein
MESPAEAVRDVVLPAIIGGEQALKDPPGRHSRRARAMTQRMTSTGSSGLDKAVALRVEPCDEFE